LHSLLPGLLRPVRNKRANFTMFSGFGKLFQLVALKTQEKSAKSKIKTGLFKSSERLRGGKVNSPRVLSTRGEPVQG